MVNVRSQPDTPPTDRPRLHVLLTEDRPHSAEHWTSQLPRLLEPQGVVSHLAQSAREAIDMAGHVEIHAAVIDLDTPMDLVRRQSAAAGDGGRWIVELFNRMPRRPPVVIITSPAFTERQISRLLHDALQLGAFSVLSRPVELEHLLEVFRRLLDRRYAGAWPGRETDFEPSN